MRDTDSEATTPYSSTNVEKLPLNLRGLPPSGDGRKSDAQTLDIHHLSNQVNEAAAKDKRPGRRYRALSGTGSTNGPIKVKKIMKNRSKAY